MSTISADTSVLQLVDEHPFLIEFLASYNPKFRLLKNPMMRATAGRLATLAKVAEIGGVDLKEMVQAIQDEVKKRGSDTGQLEGGEPERTLREERHGHRVSELKSLLHDLHNDLPPPEARARFDEVIRDISPQELGAIEEELIRDGLPVSEIQRFCDLHVSVVRGALDQAEDVNAPPGHPAHTLLAENEVITELANQLGALCADPDTTPENGPVSGWPSKVEAVVSRLSGIDNHYLRKENELFPVLERHGVTGPSQVMWGVHDEIRDQLKKLRTALAAGARPEAASAGATLARSLIEMVYKENKILLPLAMETFTNQEWASMRRGEDELGYAFSDPAGPFPAQDRVPLPIVSATPSNPLPDTSESYLDLGTGRLSLEQVDMIFRHLPVDLSFVDSDGFVRYYSETPDRIFPRTPGAIGRHVTNCHPPKSVHMVEEILAAFSAGERDVAEFWIQMGDRFVHIRYFAVRDPGGAYLGCLEVSQDVTGIRALEGERRLLEWQ
jgi:DUF438 domain-containing protein